MNQHVGIGHNGPPSPIGSIDVPFGEAFLDLFKPARHKAYYGGRGSAKSHSFAAALAIQGSQSRKRIVCARQFQNSIGDSSKEVIALKIRTLGLSNQYKIMDREIIHYQTDTRFTFIGLDRNPDSAKSLEGADICWVEEARTINKRSMEILIPTIRSPGSEIWWSWNPEKKSDPVDAYFRGETPPPRTILKYVGIEDNPWFYHTEMPDDMEHLRRGNERRYRHIWLGEYDEGFESKIFSDVVIGRIEVPKHIRPRYGMDFGFGSDPSVIVKVYVSEATKQIYIARAQFGRVPMRQLPAMIDSVIDDRDDYIKADSSNPGAIEQLVSSGFNIEGAKKGPGSVKAGILWLQGFQIIIDPDCEEMREEARAYSWQVDRLTRKVLNVPVDADNHGWDAVRYATEDSQLVPGDDDDSGTILKVRF